MNSTQVDAPNGKSNKDDAKRKVARRSKTRALAPMGVEPLAVALSEPEEMLTREYAQNKLRLGARRPPALVDTENPDGPPEVGPDPTKDPILFWAQLAAATGSPHSAASLDLATELLVLDKRGTAAALSGALAHMLDIGPRDGLEGMLAAQMVAVNRAAMRLLASGISGEQSLDVATFRLNHAARLMRLFTLQMDALNRNRGKAPSEQKVTVEHIHVRRLIDVVHALSPDEVTRLEALPAETRKEQLRMLASGAQEHSTSRQTPAGVEGAEVYDS